MFSMERNEGIKLYLNSVCRSGRDTFSQKSSFCQTNNIKLAKFRKYEKESPSSKLAQHQLAKVNH